MFDRHGADETIESLGLEGTNLMLARYWLSLWNGDSLPARSALSPARIKEHLPSIIMFNVVPNESVIVRLAGTRYRHILGAELTGKDWIAAASERHRPARLGLFTTVVQGAILLSHRLLSMSVGEDTICEEIVLPFTPEANGVVPVLAHVNLPARDFLKIKSMAQAIADPIDFRIVPLPALARAA
ncbi:MAG TPA: PAS domain-containing protein [Rhizomicrobium sp.]|nr:PAS domain-containing protein [Rhizomicrobium sp.]